ncbi:MAG TPA: DUF3987 domain-containing protein [Candidatus Obscuribacterales bacterium]
MVSNFASGFDASEALKLLSALGYNQKETIFVRYLDPAKEWKGVNMAYKFPLDAKEIDDWQHKGYNAYFIANGGGHRDADVKAGRVVFYEHDNLDKALQLDLWKTLGLPQPTIQVDTGGKSIHSYWTLDNPIPIAEWRQLQSDLLKYSNGDQSIKNPSRVMRLAGSMYLDSERKPTGNRAMVVGGSGLTHAFLELRKAIPRPAEEVAAPSLNYQPSITDEVPLISCLSKDDRALIEAGTGSDRNVNGARLARNLIGTAARLQHLGHRYAGDPYQLFIDYCNRCTPGNGWNQREWEIIWKSAQKDNPTPTLTDDYIENCVKAWHHNQRGSNRALSSVPSAGGKPSNIVAHPTAERQVNPDAIVEELDKVIQQALPASKRSFALMDLAKSFGLTTNAIGEAYNQRLAEIEQDEAREETAADLERLVNAANFSLDVAEVLPEPLAKPIKQLAEWLNLNPLAYLTILLTTASSLNKVGTVIEACPATNWYQPPQLYSGIIAVSSQKKSPILSEMASRPLAKLQAKIKEDFKEDMKAYTFELNQWNSLKGEERAEAFPDGEPEKPKLRRLSFTAGTTEGLFRQLQGNPDKGILWSCDELASLFNGANQYKGGKGDDIEVLLSMYEGAGISILRADESKNVDLEACVLSITGTIQPTVLQRLMKSDEDGNGQWARFCWVNQPVAESHLPDSGRIDLTPMLVDFYKRLDALPATTYRFSYPAWKKFKAEYKRLETKRVETAEQSTGLSSCYGKAEGRLARLALNLHITWELMAGRTPGEFISPEIVSRAIQLNRFYLAQVVGMYSEFTDSIAPHLLRVLDWAKSCEWLKVRDVIQRSSKKQRQDTKTENVRSWFIELARMGYGSVRGEGRSIEFSLNVGHVGQQPTKEPTAQPIDVAELQEFVGDVGYVGQSENVVDVVTSNEVVEAPQISGIEEQPTEPTNAPNPEPINDVVVGQEPTEQPTNSEQPTFNVGDEVQIVGGEHAGDRATITRIDAANPLHTYEVLDLQSRWTDWLPASAIAPIANDSNEVHQGLKLDDYVEILVGDDAGQRATVTGFTYFQVEVKIAGDAQVYRYFAEELRKV